MVHKGKVVYEAYPGMSPSDVHMWASAVKTITGMITATFVVDGSLDTSAPVTRYVKALVGTPWDSVHVIDLINHTTGLDTEENNASILNPDSVFVRFVYSSFGVTDRNEELEDWLQVLREVEPLVGEAPGGRYRYSSPNTHVLGMVMEGLTGLRISDVIGRGVWGHMEARMPLLVHLAPDGQGLNMGIVSSTLQDMARFGVLWTPGWNIVSDEKVVSKAALDRIRSSGDAQAFVGSAKQAQTLSVFLEESVKGANQFEIIFEDGAIYKHGNSGQII